MSDAHGFCITASKYLLGSPFWPARPTENEGCFIGQPQHIILAHSSASKHEFDYTILKDEMVKNV